MSNYYRRPGPSRVGGIGWETKQSGGLTNKTRMLNVRVPHDLCHDWREAIAKSNNTQTEVLHALMRAYIKFANHNNKEIDEHVNALMQRRERNDRQVVGQALDDAIRQLQRLRPDVNENDV